MLGTKNLQDKVGIVHLHRATAIIQDIIQEPKLLGQERADKNKQVLDDAMAGAIGANLLAQEIIFCLLDENGIEVEGMSRGQVAYEIYKYAWGLGPIEDIYRDSQVNEIRVNAIDQIYVLRKIRNERLSGISFRDDEHIRKIITRITMHDQGVALNKSNPTIESMRRDGTRTTATCPPVSKNTTLVLRKHPNRLFMPDEMITTGSIDKRIWDMLRVLVNGRANILVSGGVSSGKTTLLRTMVSEINRAARIIVLGTDNELMLGEYYPDRDIIEFEEHKESGRNLASLFRIALRYSPVTIIIEEFRGGGEAKEAIRACIRGHNGMATAHFTTCREAVEGTAKLLLEEGMNLSLGMAISEAASAFDIIVQMYGDPVRGVIMVESITEVICGQGNVEYRDIIRWMPQGKDFLEGEWKFIGGLSSELAKKLCRHTLIDDLQGVGLA